MDLSGDEQDRDNSNESKRVCRHSADQILKLEEIFKTLTHPDDNQKYEIAQQLELEPQQVKWWFQNKRAHIKNKNLKPENDALRAENERILKENMEMKERLKNLWCQSSCNGSNSLKQLQVENARLKERYEMMQKKEVSLELKLGLPKSSTRGSTSLNLDRGSSSKSSLEIQNPMMLVAGLAATEELLKLFRDESLWVKSQLNRRLVLQKNYEDVFPRVDHFNGAKTHVESSKDSQMVKIGATHLVEMFLDSEKWANIFPTIVNKAETIKVLERDSSQNQSGALLLMHGEMHVLSPLVKPREIYFLRYCVQVEAGIWVIADVSYDYLKEDGPHSSFWRFPSGCLIQQISNETSKVSWIEHVEVDLKIQTHSMYRDIVNNAIAFGAERWLMELRRIGERCGSAALEYMHFYDNGVITLPEGRRCVMKLAHQVLKEFSKNLTISSKSDLPLYFADTDDSGVRFSIRKNRNLFLSNDPFIVIVASSVSLPLPSHTVFDFLRDPARRFEWDKFCDGNPWHEIAHISTGTHPNHYVSIIQPLVSPSKDGVKIIQECFIDPLGSYVVYSPVNTQELNMAINGHDLSNVSLIIPSGFLISEDSKSLSKDSKSRGSLLTVAFQMHMPAPLITNFESAADASNALMTTVVQSIKHALLSGSELK